ncbi:hypothetical protein LRS56_11025 [Pseudomonas poae]|nr:hypothetical protein LRS56_11025 [Pseudomonas poae]
MLSALSSLPPQNMSLPLNQQPTSASGVRSASEDDHADTAYLAYMSHIRSAFRDGTLTAEERALATAAVSPPKVGAPGVQVSTFAVDGAQANDIVMIKRVPETADGPNFQLYIPEDGESSFHAFSTRGQMTAWLKDLANDPARLDKFARHFSDHLAPMQVNRVKQKMTAFVAGDINAVVGSFAFEKGDIFARLDQDVTQPPPVNGLIKTHLHRLTPDGRATYIGTRSDGEKVLFTFDAYGNLHGGSKDGFYFVKNGLNTDEPLERITQKEYARKVVRESLDNVGANDLRGLFDEFLKQLRSPGHGLGVALVVFGVPEDVANSIETIAKNPVSGALRELNQHNRLGKLFGVDKATMDSHLEQIGTHVQNAIPGYGSIRVGLDSLADTLELTRSESAATAG